ncbi:YecH family protein [Vibrio tapetis subsp. quintayensis]|uniref:YecH family metal-binding protein n=1 Tax=Vibrio tapetis TaxID=52443 RepID=UPI0025B4686D|nr:YecH family metal-binding protein [Vibrio tapetis]MDN3680182.1 YecH family protein [Vibrio tapetis subsp. quintayensis]
MSNSTHGHEVMELLCDNTLTHEKLQQEVDFRFGESMRFHTCSQQGLTLAQLMTFLISKEKVVEVEMGLTLNQAKVCHH